MERQSHQVTSSKPSIPDGGWGWVIVFGSHVISVIADGIAFSFGLLYVELLAHFGASSSATAWIGSLFMAVPLLAGPLCSALVDRFGCRWMTILGGCLSAAGFIASSFANSILVLYITFGFIAGLGLGLCYVTAVVSIAYWFDKKRTLAMSIGACGSGVGTFVYSPLTRLSLSYYGWRGTVLLLAGTLLNLCVCGALMRDPEWWVEAQKSSTASSICQDLDELKRMLETGETPPDATRRTTELEFNFQSLVNIPTYVQSTDKVPLETIEELIGREQTLRLMNSGGALKETESDSQRLNDSPVNKLQVFQVEDAFKDSEIPGQLKNNRRITQSSQIYSHLRNIRVHRNSLMYRGAILNMHKYRLKSSSCPDIFRNSITTIAKQCPDEWRSELGELMAGMMDFSMFGDLHFLLFSLATILLFIWFIVPYFYLAELMSGLGYSEDQASFVLAMIGVANTIGMLVMGLVGDKPWMNVTKTYAWCLVATGIFTLAMPFASHDIILLTSTCFGFGLFVSSNFSFTPTILVELIDLNRFTIAYGLTLLCQGIGTLIGPPLAGWIYDESKSWDLPFYLSGFFIIIGGLLVLLIPMTNPTQLCGKDVRLAGCANNRVTADA